jgi:beta-glucosidase
LAPAVNIHRNPLCGRNFEYYSEDPFLSGKLAAAITSGVQSIEGNYVTVKHFCANNQEDNRMRVSSNINERALREIYLRTFEIVVCEANPKAMMTSYNRLNGTYTANSYDLCTKVLRNEWDFDGVVMTDWYSTSEGLADSAFCMKAGNDLIMPGGKYYKKEILAGLKSGRIAEEDIIRCAANVLRSIVYSRLAREYEVGNE